MKRGEEGDHVPLNEDDGGASVTMATGESRLGEGDKNGRGGSTHILGPQFSLKRSE